MKVGKYTKLFEWQQRAMSGTEKCAKCGNTHHLNVDHIIPIAILLPLNLMDECKNWEENFEILCAGCHSFKTNEKMEISNPKLLPLLKDLIRRMEAQQTHAPLLN